MLVWLSQLVAGRTRKFAPWKHRAHDNLSMENKIITWRHVVQYMMSHPCKHSCYIVNHLTIVIGCFPLEQSLGPADQRCGHTGIPQFNNQHLLMPSHNIEHLQDIEHKTHTWVAAIWISFQKYDKRYLHMLASIPLNCRNESQQFIKVGLFIYRPIVCPLKDTRSS
jgi:hypothetical protein